MSTTTPEGPSSAAGGSARADTPQGTPAGSSSWRAVPEIQPDRAWIGAPVGAAASRPTVRRFVGRLITFATE